MADPTPAPPLSFRGYRVADVLTLVLFALGVYAAVRDGTPLPVPPALPAAETK